MDKKEKYIEYISEQLLEGTLYDIKTNTFQLSVIKELNDIPVSFSFTIGFVEGFSGEKSTYRTFPQIMMLYISNYWGIDDKLIQRDIFGRYIDMIYNKLPLLKHYVDEEYWQTMVLEVKHI